MKVISQSRIAVYLTLLFLIGAITGAVLSWQIAKKREFRPQEGGLAQMFEQHLKSHLGLSADQVEKVRPSIQKAVTALDTIHRQTSPQIDEVFRNLNAELSLSLTAEQQEKLRALDQKRMGSGRHERRP